MGGQLLIIEIRTEIGSPRGNQLMWGGQNGGQISDANPKNQLNFYN